MHSTSNDSAALPVLGNRLRGRNRRTQNLSTKLTEEEERRMEAAALAAGKTLSEWAREVLLARVGPSREASETVLLTEVVGVQLLLMNALAPLASGELIGAERYQAILKCVQASKERTAQELLTKRMRREEDR